jgi:3-oxoacyl-[acyl-carrier-protein] synthase-3
VLFGDGAGAVILRGEDGKGDNTDRGILSTHIFSDGTGYEMLYVDGGPSTTGVAGHLRMEGREVFRHAVTRMAEAVEKSLETNNLTTDDLDWVVPHQANIRIMDSMAKRLALKPEQLVVTVDKQANTSAATIPLALTAADTDGRLKMGQLVSLTAMGGGFTWGSALLRW